MKRLLIAITVASVTTMSGIQIGFGEDKDAAKPAPAESSESPPSSSTPTSPAAATPQSSTAAKVAKRDACRTDVQKQGLKAGDRVDAMQICMAQARLDCLKDAVGQKVAVKERKDFIKKCMGGEE